MKNRRLHTHLIFYIENKLTLEYILPAKVGCVFLLDGKSRCGGGWTVGKINDTIENK